MVVVNNKIGIRYGMNGPTVKMKNIGGPGMNETFIMMGYRYEYNIFQDGLTVWV